MSEKSKQAFQKFKIKKLRKLFEAIDMDNDGQISESGLIQA